MQDSSPEDSEEQQYGDVATVGELQAILEDVIAEHGEDVEVTIVREDGFCIPPSPVFEPPEDWDEYDTGTLTVGRCDD